MDYAITGSGTWPDCDVQSVRHAYVARHVARTIRKQSQNLGMRELARRSDTSHTTIRRVVAGEIWPNLETIAKLEAAIDEKIWPDL